MTELPMPLNHNPPLKILDTSRPSQHSNAFYRAGPSTKKSAIDQFSSARGLLYARPTMILISDWAQIFAILEKTIPSYF